MLLLRRHQLATAGGGSGNFEIERSGLKCLERNQNLEIRVQQLFFLQGFYKICNLSLKVTNSIAFVNCFILYNFTNKSLVFWKFPRFSWVTSCLAPG